MNSLTLRQIQTSNDSYFPDFNLPRRRWASLREDSVSIKYVL